MLADIIKLLKDLNLPPIVIAVIVTAVFGYKYRDNILAWLNMKTFSLKSHLKFHDLFNTISFNQSLVITKIKFEGDPVKSEIFKDFINTRLITLRNQCYILINTKAYKNRTEEFKSVVKQSITEGLILTRKEVEELFLNKGLAEDQISFILELFDKWYDPIYNSVQNRLDAVFQNSYYKTNFQKLISIFEVFAMEVELTTSNGVKSFEAINGYFRNVKHYGKIHIEKDSGGSEEE